MAKLSKYLVRAGWRVTVITADEASTHIEKDESLLNEIHQSVQIIRIPATLPLVHRKKSKIVDDKGQISFIKRWLSAFLFVPDIRIGWIQPAKQAAREELRKKKYDCILVSSPPYSLAILAQQLTEDKQAPVVLDMRDAWTVNPYKIHPTIFHRQIDKKIEKSTLSSLRYGITISEELRNYLRKTIVNFEEKEWRTIPNGYDEEDFLGIQSNVNEKNTEIFHLAFSGTFYSHINVPHDLFAALALLNKQLKTSNIRWQFHHIGKTNIDLEKLAQTYGIKKQVILHGYLPHRHALATLAKMNAFCIIADTRNRKSRYTGGSKLYEYLRLRKPILALLSEDSEAAETIQHADAGVVVESNEHEKIARTLKNWMENPPNFSFIGIERFSRENQAQAFIEFFEQIILKEKGPR